jgi:hypothetical protein
MKTGLTGFLVWEKKEREKERGAERGWFSSVFFLPFVFL